MGSGLLLLSRRPSAAMTARRGRVQAFGQVLQDADGVFHPLGLTLFWSLYGWKYERDRILEHLAWIAPYRFDYVRILGEVDWTGRTIDPAWPDYATVLAEFLDTAYGYGLRSEVTIVGGKAYDDAGHQRFVPTELAGTVANVVADRGDKLMLYEMANEADNDDKVTVGDMIDMARVVQSVDGAGLVSLSRPAEDYDITAATHAAGATAYTPHPRRSSHDHGWSHVRQGYDFKDFDRAVFNNEPEGPQSSVVSMDNPLQLACCRLLGILCGGAGYVLHVGQGVTGIADPNHGRPQNMWEVPNIDAIMRAVRRVDPLIPLGIENWKCVNNGRSEHPLPLDPESGFWESGEHDTAPAVNKNYAAVTHAEFCVILTGVRSVGATGPVPAGRARRACRVQAFDPLTLAVVDERELAAGQDWSLPGRGDTMAAYWIRGRYL